MDERSLDPRLQEDCIVLGEYLGASLLLMNNAHYTWFVLVPRTECVELFELSCDEQQRLWDATMRLSTFLKEALQVDKINIGAIGNIVSQLHVHIVGRRKTDPLWPGVVWGGKEKKSYEPQEISGLTRQLLASLGNAFRVEGPGV